MFESEATPRVVIAGGGGHGTVVRAIVRASNGQLGPVGHLVGFLDDRESGLPLARLGLPRLGALSLGSTVDALIVIGLGYPWDRERLDAVLRERGRGYLAGIVHADANVDDGLVIGEGSTVSRGACLGAFVTVGRHVHIAANTVVSHGVSIGDFASISPGALVGGDAVVGHGAEVGMGAVILPGRLVGRGARVGAGAVVTSDVAPGDVVIGIPARTRAGE